MTEILGGFDQTFSGFWPQMFIFSTKGQLFSWRKKSHFPTSSIPDLSRSPPGPLQRKAVNLEDLLRKQMEKDLSFPFCLSLHFTDTLVSLLCVQMTRTWLGSVWQFQFLTSLFDRKPSTSGAPAPSLMSTQFLPRGLSPISCYCWRELGEFRRLCKDPQNASLGASTRTNLPSTD